jgi:hypothetical protein
MTQRKRGRPALDGLAIISDATLLDAVLVSFGDHGFGGRPFGKLPVIWTLATI